MTISAKIVCDSVSQAGARLTTLELTYPRFIHSQLLMHRMLSRNSASSRAIPVSKMIDNILANPVIPIHFGKNQAGMQAQTEEVEREEAVTLWLESMYQAIKIAKEFEKLGLHKQIANRVLEPYSHITTLVTATEWNNFFTLRLADDAQPEIQELAKVMKEAIESSNPILTKVHLPYVTKQEKDNYSFIVLARISAARCCRVSYLNHNNEYSIQKDLTLAGNLIENRHFSPLEAVAIALDNKEQKDANFTGWKQYRTIIIENQNKNQA